MRTVISTCVSHHCHDHFNLHDQHIHNHHHIIITIINLVEAMVRPVSKLRIEGHLWKKTHCSLIIWWRKQRLELTDMMRWEIHLKYIWTHQHHHRRHHRCNRASKSLCTCDWIWHKPAALKATTRGARMRIGARIYEHRRTPEKTLFFSFVI